MDNRHSNNSLLSLFSRGATPPIGGIQQAQAQPQRQPSPSPAQPVPESQTTSSLDSLFQQLEQSPRAAPEPTTTTNNYNVYPHNLQPYGLPPSVTNSGPTTPSMSLIDEPTTIVSPAATNAERQSALLSLLGGPPPTSNRPAPPPPVAPSNFQPQIPSPPGSRKSNSPPSHLEMQGKFLLEQLMSGYALIIFTSAAAINSYAGMFSTQTSRPNKLTTSILTHICTTRTRLLRSQSDRTRLICSPLRHLPIPLFLLPHPCTHNSSLHLLLGLCLSLFLPLTRCPPARCARNHFLSSTRRPQCLAVAMKTRPRGL